MKALVTRGKVIRYTHKWSSFKYRGSWPGNLEHQSSVSALTHTVQLALANRYLLKFKVQASQEDDHVSSRQGENLAVPGHL